MARPLGAEIKMWMRWSGDDPGPTVGMFFRTDAGRWYEITAVRRMRTERPKFAMRAIVRGKEFLPPAGSRIGALTWDPRGGKRPRRSRAPLL